MYIYSMKKKSKIAMSSREPVDLEAALGFYSMHNKVV